MKLPPRQAKQPNEDMPSCNYNSTGMPMQSQITIQHLRAPSFPIQLAGDVHLLVPVRRLLGGHLQQIRYRAIPSLADPRDVLVLHRPYLGDLRPGVFADVRHRGLHFLRVPLGGDGAFLDRRGVREPSGSVHHILRERIFRIKTWEDGIAYFWPSIVAFVIVFDAFFTGGLMVLARWMIDRSREKSQVETPKVGRVYAELRNRCNAKPRAADSFNLKFAFCNNQFAIIFPVPRETSGGEDAPAHYYVFQSSPPANSAIGADLRDGGDAAGRPGGPE